MMASRLALALGLLPTAFSNQVDTLYESYTPPAACLNGCARWAQLAADCPSAHVNASTAAAMWQNGAVPAAASNACAIPGAVVDKATGGPETASAGPFCYCKHPARDATVAAYCLPQLGIPEQINLQYASQDTVIAAFVTYELEEPSEMPVAMLSEAGGASEQQISGVSHFVAFDPVIPKPKGTGKPMGARNWTMHFVKFTALKPATHYTYRVKSGAQGGVWSAGFTFRSVRAAPDTRLAMYGDMAITRYNAVSNLLDDCLSGRVDVFAHMGDHCYDLGQADDRRGDAYMNAMQPLLSVCPWIPIVRK